ncbi:glycoside hydrolase family 2 protein [Sphingobacterium ginsenosidimutans]
MKIILVLCSLFPLLLFGQSAMIHIEGRQRTSLNGLWEVIIDPFDAGSGDWAAYYKDRKPLGNTDFVESSFEGGHQLYVPGDFNSQLPELSYYESSIWYKRPFKIQTKQDNRFFIHFAAVNYKAEVYLNGVKIGEHEGGFTPFQFEVTDHVKIGENSLIVKSNNQRIKDGIPGLGFDWFNYGGITRDVELVQTPKTYIRDYFIQLSQQDENIINGYVSLDGPKKEQAIAIRIPELNFIYKTRTDSTGKATLRIPFRKKTLWTPAVPKLYAVQVDSETDRIEEEIGFRTIRVDGTNILLNGKSIFLKGVNIHEEVPQRRSRAYNESDYKMLLDWAKELGCNYVRLVHYPHHEKMIRMAEQMGLMVWEELPIYQGIDFADPGMMKKMNLMLREMIARDKNRAATIIWSLSNETYSSLARDSSLTALYHLTKALDNTRLVTSAFNNMRFEGNKAYIEDKMNRLMDVMAINQYIGWYKAWPENDSEVEWISHFNKPLIFSEFGGEAVFGNNTDPKRASSWSEDYLVDIYKRQFSMFKNISFLRGLTPWLLVDFRSPGRAHPVYQKGWNRKGLLSERGQKKKAWYLVADYFKNLTSPEK